MRCTSVLITLAILAGCTLVLRHDPILNVTPTDADSDADSDSDADADSDADSDNDADFDSDTDFDSIADFDNDADSDSDADPDPDSDPDLDPDPDIGPTGDGVPCPDDLCRPGDVCCFSLLESVLRCVREGSCSSGFRIDCDEQRDCPGGDQFCCGNFHTHCKNHCDLGIYPCESAAECQDLNIGRPHCCWVETGVLSIDFPGRVCTVNSCE